MTRVATTAALVLVLTAGDCFRSTPLPPTTELSWSAVASGGNHTCGLTGDGTAFCWGLATAGQLGAGANSPRRVGVTPRRVDTEETFRALTAGRRHTCGLAEDGGVLCWGGNGSGQLGVDAEAAADRCSAGLCVAPAPVRGSDTLDIEALDAGAAHTCGLAASGDLLCWGSNRWGQLGAGEAGPGGASSAPGRVRADVDFTAVSAGVRHTCALAESGDVWCWGENGVGQAGPLTGESCGASGDTAGGEGGVPCATEPSRVPSERAFTAVAAGGSHTCALDGSGGAWCWGRDRQDELGQGRGWPEECEPPGATSPVGCSRRPVRVSGDHAFSGITAGGAHACGRTAGGRVWCWGDNALGQTGYCGVGAAQTPQRVCRGTDYRAVSAGGIHTCGVTAAGDAWCWGANGEGQLGAGSTQFSYFGPIEVGEALSGG